MMRAPISGHLSCYLTYVPLLSANLDRKPILETPSMIGPCGCRTRFCALVNGGQCWHLPELKVGGTIPATISAKMRSNVGTSIAQELKWHSLLNNVHVLSAVNSLREGQRQSRPTECEHMDIANQCPATLRMTVLNARGATNTFRAGQSYLTTHSIVAKAAATRSYRHGQLKHDLLLFLFLVGSKCTQGCF